MNPYRRFAVCALVLLFASAVPANATLPTAPYIPPEDAPVAVSLIDHLHAELRSKDAVRRQYALDDVVALASCSASCTVSFRSLPGKMIRVENETGIGSLIDLTALLPDVEKIYYTDRSDERRLQALDALLSIGNERSMKRLINRPARSSAHVHKMTQQGVARYFVDKYPALRESALRRGFFSLDDVDRAREQQERMMRRTAQRG